MPALFQAMHAMKNRCRNWCGELKKRWVRWRSPSSILAPMCDLASRKQPNGCTARCGKWGAYAGFLMGREVASVMLPRKRGTILFTGATASMRGASGFSAFAGAKFALRALAQSMARELGPENIHVAHVVIDGAIDSNFIRENMPDVDRARQEDRILSPDEIAATYVWLHRQKPNAWTHELDLRPWKEKW